MVVCGRRIAYQQAWRITTLVDPATLLPTSADPRWAVVDCRFMLTDAGWGAREYLAASYSGGGVCRPGSRPLRPQDGTPTDGIRFPRPLAFSDTRALWHRQRHSSRRIRPGTACTQSRLWWMLRWLGHNAVAVLDGGSANGRRGTSDVVRRRTRPPTFAPTPGPESSSPLRRSRLRTAAAHLLDAARRTYRGEIEPLDRAAGHIPGAINAASFRQRRRARVFRTPEELRKRVTRARLRAADEVICTAAPASPRATTCSRSNTPVFKAQLYRVVERMVERS